MTGQSLPPDLAQLAFVVFEGSGHVNVTGIPAPGFADEAIGVLRRMLDGILTASGQAPTAADDLTSRITNSTYTGHFPLQEGEFLSLPLLQQALPALSLRPDHFPGAVLRVEPPGQRQHGKSRKNRRAPGGVTLILFRTGRFVVVGVRSGKREDAESAVRAACLPAFAIRRRK